MIQLNKVFPGAKRALLLACLFAGVYSACDTISRELQVKCFVKGRQRFVKTFCNEQEQLELCNNICKRLNARGHTLTYMQFMRRAFRRIMKPKVEGFVDQLIIQGTKECGITPDHIEGIAEKKLALVKQLMTNKVCWNQDEDLKDIALSKAEWLRRSNLLAVSRKDINARAVVNIKNELAFLLTFTEDATWSKEKVTKCQLCRNAPTARLWQHHCRTCGGIVCSECVTETDARRPPLKGTPWHKRRKHSDGGKVKICVGCKKRQDRIDQLKSDLGKLEQQTSKQT